MADTKKIVLIEDDRASSRLMAAFLEKKGYRVLESHEARFGIELTLKEKPDLLIADILLPDMKGSDAVKELKMSAMGKDLKVLFLTSLLNKKAGPETLTKLTVEGLQYPALAKPFKPEKLIEVIDNLIGEGKN